MTDKKKPPEAAQSFKSVCVIENSADGKGIRATAYGNDGKVVATGKDFVSGSIMSNFIDNMQELVSVGGQVIGDSYAQGREKNFATFKEGGITLNVAKGLCDVSTVDHGGVPEGTMRMGVVLKDVPFTAPKP